MPTTPTPDQPAPEQPRHVIARLDPKLRDSPLRRALYDANLRPVTTAPPEDPPQPDEPDLDDEQETETP